MTPEKMVEHRTASQMRFAEFAGMGAGQVPDNPVDAMQVKLLRWQSHNFGVPNDCEITLGIGEEIGEMAEAFEANSFEDALDAMGDLMVYSGQLAGSNRLAMSSILDVVKISTSSAAAPGMLKRAGGISGTLGRLNHVVLKHQQKIRGFADPDPGIYRAAVFERVTAMVGAMHLAFTFQSARWGRNVAELPAIETIYIDVGTEVAKRDWTKDATKGGS